MIPVCHRLPDQERAACHLHSGSAWNADGEIREVSKPFPPLPTTDPPAAISSSWPGGAILLAAGPAQCPMYLRCHARSVSPNGSYLFIPAATQAYGMFSSQLTCFFSQPRRSVRLIWGPLIPAKVDQTRQRRAVEIFEPSLDAPLPPPTFSHLLRFIWFCTCKRKKKRTVLQRCTEKITRPLHKTEFI